MDSLELYNLLKEKGLTDNQIIELVDKFKLPPTDYDSLTDEELWSGIDSNFKYAAVDAPFRIKQNGGDLTYFQLEPIYDESNIWNTYHEVNCYQEYIFGDRMYTSKDYSTTLRKRPEGL